MAETVRTLGGAGAMGKMVCVRVAEVGGPGGQRDG
jgi:hypothetical protein